MMERRAIFIACHPFPSENLEIQTNRKKTPTLDTGTGRIVEPLTKDDDDEKEKVG